MSLLLENLMSISSLLVTTIQVIQLSCTVQYVGNTTTEYRKFDFTLDLQNKSGEAIYQYLDKIESHASNNLTVTPNYIIFPVYSSSSAKIDRRDLSISFTAFDGTCKVLETQGIERKI